MVPTDKSTPSTWDQQVLASTALTAATRTLVERFFSPPPSGDPPHERFAPWGPKRDELEARWTEFCLGVAEATTLYSDDRQAMADSPVGPPSSFQTMFIEGFTALAGRLSSAAHVALLELVPGALRGVFEERLWTTAEAAAWRDQWEDDHLALVEIAHQVHRESREWWKNPDAWRARLRELMHQPEETSTATRDARRQGWFRRQREPEERPPVLPDGDLLAGRTVSPDVAALPRVYPNHKLHLALLRSLIAEYYRRTGEGRYAELVGQVEIRLREREGKAVEALRPAVEELPEMSVADVLEGAGEVVSQLAGLLEQARRSAPVGSDRTPPREAGNG